MQQVGQKAASRAKAMQVGQKSSRAEAMQVGQSPSNQLGEKAKAMTRHHRQISWGAYRQQLLVLVFSPHIVLE